WTLIAPDFDITVEKSRAYVGKTCGIRVQVNRRNGWVGPVFLALEELPPQLIAKSASAVVGEGSQAADFEFRIGPEATEAAFTIAATSGLAKVSKEIELDVCYFDIECPRLDITPGETKDHVIPVVRHGYDLAIDLEFFAPPGVAIAPTKLTIPPGANQ